MSGVEPRTPAISVDGPEPGTLEARASLVFKVMGGIGIAGIVLSLIPDSLSNSALQSAAFNLAAGVASAVYVITARGIDRGRPWAFAAARPLLVVLGLWGAYAAIAGVTQGVVRIPFEVALAVWAFLGARGDTPPVRPERRSLGAVGAAIPAVAVMAFGHLVFGWGGVLDVHPNDLVASLQVDCGEPGEAPPGEITVRYDWSWTRGAPLPNEIDTLFMGWDGNDAEDRPLYIYDSDLNEDPAIRDGQRGELGRSLLEEIRGASPGFQWAVDLSARGYRPGSVTVVLRRAPDEVAGPLSVAIRASYIHLGIWRSDAPPVTCTWTGAGG